MKRIEGGKSSEQYIAETLETLYLAAMKRLNKKFHSPPTEFKKLPRNYDVEIDSGIAEAMSQDAGDQN